MLNAWITRRSNGQLRAPRRHGAGHRPAFRPRLEAFEDRVVPATVMWDGGHPTSNRWSEPLNWVGNVAPVAGDDLVFPAGAARLINFNDFPSDTVFNSLGFSGSGYAISGVNVLSLGTFGMFNTAPSGQDSYNGPIQLDGNRMITVASGGNLVLRGVLSGSGGITKGDSGTLTLDGPGANTYTGETAAAGGVLQLNKGTATSTTVAISGNLRISSFFMNAEVRLLRADQIADNATVTVAATVTKAGSNTVVLNLNHFADAIGALNMTGGSVVDGRALTLNGNLMAQSADASHPAVINSDIVLGPGTFTVNKTAGSAEDLTVFGQIGGSSVPPPHLIKEGDGVMKLGATVFVPVEVNAGTLLLDGAQLDVSPVILRNDGKLAGGDGAIVDSISTQDGFARTLDDGGFGFTAPGWTNVTGQGFGNDITRAAPSTGIELTATWAFTGLTPGLYRVFATWTGGANRTSRAPFSIFDGLALRRTTFIDEERAPAGGPHSGGAVFQQLGGSVNITSGILRVSLTNSVPTETDGALIIADAVRIERLAGTVSPGGLSGVIQPELSVHHDVTLGPGSSYQVDFFNANNPSLDPQVQQLAVDGVFSNSDALLELSASTFTIPDPGRAFRIISREGGAGVFENLPNNNDTIELVTGGLRHIFSINYLAGTGNDIDLIYQDTATQVRDLTLSPDVINEGERVTLRGALTDPNRGDVLSLRVDWGDGAVQTFNNLGTNPFHFTHTYTDNSPAGAPYLVRAEWFDQHGAGNFRKLPVTVNNVPPRLFLGGAEAVRAGELMRHTGHFTDPGADAFTATVDYGDGSGPQPLIILPGQQLSFEHRYTTPGRYRVTVTVLDDDGGLATDSFLVIVL